MHVAVAADRGFEIGLVVTVHTLLARAKGPVSLHVIMGPGGIETRAQEWLTAACAGRGCTLSMQEVAKDFAGSYKAPWAHHSKATLFRLLLPDLLPGLERVLYVDSDLVIADDLTAVWNTDLHGHAIAAVRDYWFPTMQVAGLGRPPREALGFTGDTPYFNGGVQVMDMARWRREGTAAKALDLLFTKAALLDMADQDALNLVLQGDWAELPPRWNVQVAAMRAISTLPHAFQRTLEGMRELRTNPGIVHYTGPHKPWNPPAGLRNMERPRFSRALAASGYLTLGEHATRLAATTQGYARAVAAKFVKPRPAVAPAATAAK